MASPVATLLETNLKSWFSAKGLWMVFAAALVPALLVGAWVTTHQRDVVATDVRWEPEGPIAGAPINFTGVFTNTGHTSVGPFNVTLRVEIVPLQANGEKATPVTKATNATRVEHLAAGASGTLQLAWTPSNVLNSFSQPDVGTYTVVLDVDSDDALGEIEEFNNVVQKGVQIQLGTLGQSVAPAAPQNLTGNPNATATVDAAVETLTWTPSQVYPKNETRFVATIRNDGPQPLVDANVTVRLGRLPLGPGAAPMAETHQAVSLATGDATNVTLNWTADDVSAPFYVAFYYVEAFVNVTQDANDTGAENNHHVQVLIVDRPLEFEKPPERATIKDFYLDVLNLLHLRVLLPLIGLFYAGGVLADERERGNLTYLLTRPLPRWWIPVSKFGAGFLVAAFAVALGILVTFGLLFGAPHGDIGFLTTPLLVSLVALLVYGAFFILLGVLVERPYLVGLGFVIGWETIAGNFVPWVKNLTLSHYLDKAIATWKVDQGLQWLPSTSAGVDALRNLLLAALAFLVAAGIAMKRRQFDV